jgi:microcystin-dependent protein
MMWATATPPTGWLLCNGQSTSGYTALAALVGATVPDMRGDVPVGFSSGDSDFGTLLGTGGVKSVTLTGAQSGTSVHGHADNIDTANDTHTHTFTYTDTAGNVGDSTSPRWDSSNESADATRTVSTLSDDTHKHTITGGVSNSVAANATEAHTNLQPYIVINYIIKF